MSNTEQTIPFADFNNQQVSGKELMTLLYNLTGYIYTFATVSSMRWGQNGTTIQMSATNPEGFFQLMPDSTDAGFFDWYCYNRPEQQFFESKNNAVLHFIYFWQKWKSLGDPKAF